MGVVSTYVFIINYSIFEIHNLHKFGLYCIIVYHLKFMLIFILHFLIFFF